VPIVIFSESRLACGARCILWVVCMDDNDCGLPVNAVFMSQGDSISEIEDLIGDM
jgi:hypothetical protein